MGNKGKEILFPEIHKLSTPCTFRLCDFNIKKTFWNVKKFFEKKEIFLEKRGVFLILNADFYSFIKFSAERERSGIALRWP